MAFDWREYLTLAERLFADGLAGVSDEVRWRPVIGRAYYAAFHTAREYLEQVDFHQFSEKGIHYEVNYKFRDHPDPVYQEISEDLNRLFQARVKADYRAAESHSEQRARLALQIAHHILGNIQHLITS